MSSVPKALLALLAQLGGWVLVWFAARAGILPASPWPLAGAQAVCATALAALLRSARWWLAIHLAFSPLVLLAHRLDLPPGGYLAAFLVFAVVYWSNFRTQVPLYLSNRQTVAEVARLLPADRPVSVLDPGSGTGSVVRPLARLRPNCRFTGIEAAPAPHWLARLLGGGLPNLVLQRGDFFARSWAGFDVVYVFLSPVPMARVWQKARAELPPGALLLSNSFAVPGVKPAFVVEVADRRRTRLYAYYPVPADGEAARKTRN